MSQSAFQRFIQELRRRHVPQTAAVYLVAAWAAIEFSDVVVPNLNGPQWVVTAVIVAAGVGFPVVLVLAWMFDWGSEGVVRTADDDRHPDTGSPTGPPRSTPWMAAIAVLAVGIGSALAVAALLSDGGGTGGPAGGDPEASGPARAGGEGDVDVIAPRKPLIPGEEMPGLEGMDSITRRVVRDLGEGGLENLARLREWEALGRLGARGVLGDSAWEAMGQLAREVALEGGVSVVIREPRNWGLGNRVPVSLAVGDTLLVSGVAVDTAGVVAVSVDGETVVEVEEPRPSVPFEARIVGRRAVGLRDVPIVVRTADGRELETVYSIATPSDGG